MSKFVLEYKSEGRKQKCTIDAKDVPDALTVFWESIPAGQPWPSIISVNGCHFVDPLEKADKNSL